MFKFDNTHIFTGYLKQKLSSINIPTCKIYTKEFSDYLAKHGREDPRIIESIDSVVYADDDMRLATRVNYLKNNELYNYFWKCDASSTDDLGHNAAFWKRVSNIYYDSEKAIPGLTKSLHSPGRFYDTVTHEYLGEYLRFLRDYHNINLMSLYNCFNNNVCSNLYYKHTIKVPNPKFNKDLQEDAKTNPAYINSYTTFDSRDPKYIIYALPVKLFADYTIAIDSYQGIEMFCGLYNTKLDDSDKSIDLITKTYVKKGTTVFSQPFLYDKLNEKNWSYDKELYTVTKTGERRLNNKIISRWDIANREQDLKLFIKVPTSCKSSIVILEGDFRYFNDARYAPVSDKTSKSFGTWAYQQNHTIINFDVNNYPKTANLNNSNFTLIGKLQLLEFNTGESYPFADRLVEYLSGSAITPIDEIPDNIKRTQRVMRQNQHYFKIEGLWENKMQKILYDYITNAGPIEVNANGKLIDKRTGYLSRLGHTSKSTLYDVLGYVDRDAEKWYASWKAEEAKETESYKVKMEDSIQSVDIYNGLFDI